MNAGGEGNPTPIFGASKGTHRDSLSAWMEELAPYGIFTVDSSLVVQSWNRWLVERSGISANDVIGRGLLELFPSLKERRMEEYFVRATQGEVSVLSSALHRYLLPFPAAEPTQDVPHMLQTVRIGPMGEHGGAIISIEDVTLREMTAAKLRRQYEFDRLLSLVLKSLLAAEDPAGEIGTIFTQIAPIFGLEAYWHHHYNRATKSLVLSSAAGVSPKQKDGLAEWAILDATVPNDGASNPPFVLGKLQDDQTPRAAALRALGLTLYCSFPLTFGHHLLGTLSFGSYARDSLEIEEVSFLTTFAQFLAVALDRADRVTQLRNAERILSNQAETLELKVNERTARLHETISQLESFSYTVAHDLRAPIRALKGYSEVLLDDHSNVLPADARHILNRLHHAGIRLDALTRDLLQFNQVARREVELTAVDAEDIVKTAILFSPSLEKVVTIQRPLGKIWGQPTLLQQCFSNLFDNAIKFRMPGGEPKIVVRAELAPSDSRIDPAASSTPFNPSTVPLVRDSVSPAILAARKSGKRLRLWIEDNGIGIDPQIHQKIFGIFERGPGVEKIEGTGIGLAIVARAMQQMDGACGVESTPGKGSHFWLDLWAV